MNTEALGPHDIYDDKYPGEIWVRFRWERFEALVLIVDPAARTVKCAGSSTVPRGGIKGFCEVWARATAFIEANGLTEV